MSASKRRFAFVVLTVSKTYSDLNAFLVFSPETLNAGQSMDRRALNPSAFFACSISERLMAAPKDSSGASKS